MNKTIIKNNDKAVSNLFNKIEGVIFNEKNKAIYQINNTLVNTYFNIDKIIVENEQNGNIRAEYGKEILRNLSKRLTNRFGSGFSRSNLQNMRLFFGKYKKYQPVAGKLIWPHIAF